MKKNIPIWLLWLSLIVLSAVEFVRLIGGLNQHGFIVASLMFALLWVVPSTCIWHAIRRTTYMVPYPVWLLWIILVVSTLFKLIYSVFLGFNILPEQTIFGIALVILIHLFFLIFSILIPAYTMWIVIIAKKDSKGV